MNYRPLGSTGIRVSEIGFGGWQLGGRGWGAFRADEALRAVARALELGINLFDTAGVYGFGRSEETLGKALRDAPPDTVIVTKAGLVWDDRGRVSHDNRPESLARQLDGSSRRLRRERIDVCLLHWPDPGVPIVESAGALEEFRRRGRIRAWGFSNFPVADVLLVSSRLGAPVLSYPVNALEEYAEEHLAAGIAGREILERAAVAGWGFLAFDVLCRGLLAGRHGVEVRFGKRDVRSRDRRYRGALRVACIERAQRLAEEARGLGVSPAAVAVRSILDRPGVTSALVGMRTPLQVEECVAASALPTGKIVWGGIDP